MEEMGIEIFCSYAREDQRFLRELTTHLRALQRQGLFTTWADTDITPGMNYEEEIKIHLNTAQVILLLISPDFIASEYCYSVEMKRAMERHEQGEAVVIPIILRPTHFEKAPFAKLQVLPTNGIPISDKSWGWDSDRAFFDVVNGILSALEKQPMNLSGTSAVLRARLPEDELTKPPPVIEEIKLKPLDDYIPHQFKKWGPLARKWMPQDLTEFLEKEGRAELQTYIYISDRKVNMLYPQIPHSIREQIASHLDIDPAYLDPKAEQSNQEAARYAKVRLVAYYITTFLDVGTIEQPKTYFVGPISANCITNGSAIFFGSEIIQNTTPPTSLYVGLNGSLNHMIGPEYRQSEEVMRRAGRIGQARAEYIHLTSDNWQFYYQLGDVSMGEDVHSRSIVRERTSGSVPPRRKWKPLKTLAKAIGVNIAENSPIINEARTLDSVRRVIQGMSGSRQQYKFLARTLLYGERGGNSILLGTPIYIAFDHSQLYSLRSLPFIQG